jgi:glutathione S-transferase
MCRDGALKHVTSIETPTAVLGCSSGKKGVFYDMVHSNNAARVRLYLTLAGIEDFVDQKMVVYADLQSPQFALVNPLRKVPAFITEDGQTLFESNVILQYVHEKYGLQTEFGRNVEPKTPEHRAAVQLCMRIHDLYISSPNSTQPGMSHTQGCMYLAPYETKHCRKGREMERPMRASKLAELWKQLNWLEGNARIHGGPFLVGQKMTFADLNWFPTCVFMEFMLPRVFGWADLFRDASGGFPYLQNWYEAMLKEPAMQTVHNDIWNYWVKCENEGQFVTIQDETRDPAFKWLYTTADITHTVPLSADADGSSVSSQLVKLNYTQRAKPGFRVGRYVDQADKGDVMDVHVPTSVRMGNARNLSPSPSLNTWGFELRSCPSLVKDFNDDGEVVRVYYPEMRGLIKNVF